MTTYAYASRNAAEMFSPPSPYSVDPDLCREVLAEHEGRWFRDRFRDAARFTDPPGPVTAAVLEHVLAALHQVNDASWHADTSGRATMHLARYNAGDELAWHCDNHPRAAAMGWGPPLTHSVSASVQLSDTDDYTGGALFVELSPDANEASTARLASGDGPTFGTHAGLGIVPAPRERGTVVLLHGHTWHYMSPVFTGSRASLLIHLTEANR